MKSAGSWKEHKFLLVLHGRHKLVVNQCLSMGPAELQPDFCEQKKGIQQLLTKEHFVTLSEQRQTFRC